MFHAYSLTFIGEDVSTLDMIGDEIRVHRLVLEDWIRRGDFSESGAMLVRIHVCGSEINRICCIGAPHREDREHVYIPPWIMENLGLDIDGHITIEPFVEDIPIATMIYLKPMDNAIYHTDIRECFERALDSFHVLEVGTMLSVCIDSLGGYPVQAYVDRLEPAAIVRLGGEVGVEFIEPDGGIPEFVPRDIPPVEPVEPVASEPVNYKKIQEEVRASWLKRFKKD